MMKNRTSIKESHSCINAGPPGTWAGNSFHARLLRKSGNLVVAIRFKSQGRKENPQRSSREFSFVSPASLLASFAVKRLLILERSATIRQ
jgi:hypothetical protein